MLWEKECRLGQVFFLVWLLFSCMFIVYVMFVRESVSSVSIKLAT